MYRISNSEASDSLTLYQPIEFKKYATSGELDNSKYPEYVGTLNVEISGEDERIINSETIEKISYEALNTVYYPLRTIAQQKERINFTLAGRTETQDFSGNDDPTWLYLYKKN